MSQLAEFPHAPGYTGTAIPAMRFSITLEEGNKKAAEAASTNRIMLLLLLELKNLPAADDSALRLLSAG